jgi:hypothetical protein
VVVWLTVRRFFCDQVDCSACTFAEQVPGLTERHARQQRRPEKEHWLQSRWPCWAGRVAADSQGGERREPVDVTAADFVACQIRQSAGNGARC